MSVLNEITKAVTETAKTAAKISSDMVEVTRLNVAIGVEEDKVTKQFYEIGRKVYEKYTDSKEIIDGEITEGCIAIKDIEKNIAEMKARIFSLKKIKECPKCKEVLDTEMGFCFKCGEKQPVVEIIIEEEDVPECDCGCVNEESSEEKQDD
ncbi:MAG: hypothetical protein FWH55_10500 [Oscillospiraceae bacterium]|nr:hypothetical protein [Oscillospiraceae bacterium]